MLKDISAGKRLRGGMLTALLLFLTAVLYLIFAFPPRNFESGARITIEKGTTVSGAGQILAEQSFIKYPFLFKALVYVFGGKSGVIAGTYIFERPVSVFAVARTLIGDGYGVRVFKITIPEGRSNAEIAEILSKNLVNFQKEKFLALAKNKEGYLFPDTYFFEPETKPEIVIKAMSDNFDEKIASIKDDIELSIRSLDQIVIMASLLEGEARTEETRKIVAGILWKRFDNNYPLQVDAVFKYLLGKGSAELSTSDLAFDSPYNTYRYKGLPPGAISNPGLDTILSAIHPMESRYWFYLSDKDGKMHYAVSFDEHKANKEKYLR